jgi:hypothetical protein
MVRISIRGLSKVFNGGRFDGGNVLRQLADGCDTERR